MALTRSKVPEQTAPALSLEEMKQFVLHHFGTFANQQDSSHAQRSLSADFLDHDKPAGVAVGIEPAKIIMEHAHQRCPDLHVTVKDILAELDKVMVRNEWTASRLLGRSSPPPELKAWRWN